VSEPALYRLPKFHIPNPMPIFLSIGRLSKESFEVIFRNKLIFTVKSCNPTPNSTPWPLYATAYSIYSLLPSIWRPSPSAT
jgi:hypothetical protein